eukprot:m.245998 g.245998  ORF g.245998 m.245998 type:complete len:568 (-) comp14878_c0_seq1:305-2008(-)
MSEAQLRPSVDGSGRLVFAWRRHDVAALAEVDLADIIGFSFTSGIGPKGVYGLLTCVKKSASNSVAQWKAWIYFLLLMVFSFLAISHLLGPLTTAALMAATIIYHNKIFAVLHDYDYRLENQRETFSLFAVGSFIFIIVSFVSSFAVDTSAWTQAVYVLSVAHIVLKCRRFLLARFSLPSDMTFPSPSWPIEVYFYSDNGGIEAFAAVRSALLEAPETKELTTVPIGNSFLEAFCSVMVYCKLYNSRIARRITVTFFTYLLPLLCFIQAIFSLSPPVFNFLVAILGAFRTDLALSFALKSTWLFRAFVSLLRLDFLIPEGIFESLYLFTSQVYSWFSWLTLPLIEYEQYSTYVIARLRVFFSFVNVLVSPVFIASRLVIPRLLLVLQHMRTLATTLPLLNYVKLKKPTAARKGASQIKRWDPSYEVLESSPHLQLERPSSAPTAETCERPRRTVSAVSNPATPGDSHTTTFRTHNRTRYISSPPLLDDLPSPASASSPDTSPSRPSRLSRSNSLQDRLSRSDPFLDALPDDEPRPADGAGSLLSGEAAPAPGPAKPDPPESVGASDS